jgi:LCP family protein required for cell wall assembly
MAPFQPRPAHPHPRTRRNQRLAILAGLLAVVLVAAGVLSWRVLSFAQAVGGVTSRPALGSVAPFASAAPAVAVREPPTGLAAQIERGERVNFLVLGYGGAGHDGAYLTDSMLVVSLNAATRQATMISVPRDIWVKIPTNGKNGSYWKINAAYPIGMEDRSYPRKDPAFRGVEGGAHLSTYVVQQVLGITIHYWVALDFSAFRTAVDAVNGVDVTVERAFDVYRYPANDDPDINPGWISLHFDAGPQHMVGERALAYARARYSDTPEEGTDFGRARRQQRLVEAIKRQVFSVGGLRKVLPLMDALETHVRTNLGLTDLFALFNLGQRLDESLGDRVVIDSNNFLEDRLSADGQQILVPREGNWSALHAHMAQILGIEARPDDLNMTYGPWMYYAPPPPPTPAPTPTPTPAPTPTPTSTPTPTHRP